MPGNAQLVCHLPSAHSPTVTMSKLKQDSASVPISRDVTLIPAVGGARIMVNRTQLYAAR